MRDAIATLFGQKLPAPVEGAIEKLLRLDRLDRLWEDVPGADDRLIASHPLAMLNVRPQVSQRDLALIPKQGPVVAVANHPFGLIEGAILPSLFLSVRPDVKIMANHLLAGMPETNRLCIYRGSIRRRARCPRQSQRPEGRYRLAKTRRLAGCVSRRRSVAPESERALHHRPGMEPQRGPADPHHRRHRAAGLFSRRQQRLVSPAGVPASASAHRAASARVFQ